MAGPAGVGATALSHSIDFLPDAKHISIYIMVDKSAFADILGEAAHM